MNLQDEIAQELSSKMCSAMDFEILSDVLVNACGWTRVVLEPMSGETSQAIDAWLRDKCQEEYRTMGLVFLFKESKDATWFTLMWS